MPAQKIRLGSITVSVLNLGDLRFRLKDVERLPESEWRPRYGELFDRPLLFPSQSIHIATGEASILVDAGDYALFASTAPAYTPENYAPPPPLLEQLAQAGISNGDVTHVVITHAHYDHLAGATMKVGGRYSATFSRARYTLGRADWEDPDMQKALNDPSSPESLTLGVLKSEGVLDLVDGEQQLTRSVSTIASPGESGGHRIVRVSSGGQTLYCLGDLFHHAVEVEDVKLMARWCDARANIESRRSLIRAALAENAFLVAAHMPPGRLSGSAENPWFVPL